ncbi:hypothetical protein ACTXT7_015865 [Hymenolepis weldensis]
MRGYIPEEEVFKEFYVTDRNINLVSLDLSSTLSSSKTKDETCLTPTLEPMNAENLVRGCIQYLHVSEVPHSAISTQLSKSDSARTQH